MDIEQSLDSFKEKTDVILALTRYDGIDLEECPLLILWHLPDAVNLMESFLCNTLNEENELCQK